MADEDPPLFARTKVKYKEPDKWPDGFEDTESDNSIEENPDHGNEKGSRDEARSGDVDTDDIAAASASRPDSINFDSKSTPTSPTVPIEEQPALAPSTSSQGEPSQLPRHLERAQTLERDQPTTSTGAIRKSTGAIKKDTSSKKIETRTRNKGKSIKKSSPKLEEWYSRTIRNDSGEYGSDDSGELPRLRGSLSQSSLTRYTVDEYGRDPAYGFHRERRTGQRLSSTGDLFMAEQAGREVRVLCQCGAGSRFLKRLVRGGSTCERKLTVLYFIINGRPETFMFCRDIPPSHFREAILGAAGAHPCDTVMLRNNLGQIIGLAPDLETNTPSTAYTVIINPQDEDGEDLDSETGEEHKCPRPCTRPPPQTLTRDHVMCMGLLPTLELGMEPIGRQRVGGGRILDARRASEPHHHVVWSRFNDFRGIEVTMEEETALMTANVDCYTQSDEKILAFMFIMFVNLGFFETFSIQESVLRNFLYEVYKHYNEVPFHNFRHSFCVAQMFYAIMKRGKDLPLDDLTVLILYVSCICHDLDHPGYNNIYQINARTDLAIRYNDISPLENHHCSVAFRILQLWDCNIFREFPVEQFRLVREGIIRCILATDMARHNVILGQFMDITPPIDITDELHMQLLTMVLIKVADISNEVRPLPIAEPWLDRLLEVCMCGTIQEAIDVLLEFFTQSDLEKRLGLPITPFMDRAKVTKPTSQCAFIGLVLLPLNTALIKHFPQLEDLLLAPAREALAHYTTLAEEMTPPPGSGNVASNAPSTSGLQQAAASDEGASTSGSAAAGGAGAAAGSPEREAPQPGSPASFAQQFCSETEVDVSEKAIKFKISTEGSVDRRSYPSSRKSSFDTDKGSREAGLSNVDLVRAFHLPSSPSPPPLEEDENKVREASPVPTEPPGGVTSASSSPEPCLDAIEAITEQPGPSTGLEASTSKSKSTKKCKPSPSKSSGKTSPNPSTSLQKTIMNRLRSLADRFRDRGTPPTSPNRDPHDKSKGRPDKI